MAEPQKVVRDGKVAVLISPGYGMGWSTSVDSDMRKFFLFDRRFVEARAARVHDIGPVVRDLIRDRLIYCGGWRDVEIMWLPEGTKFYVSECDGNESLITMDNFLFTA